LRAPILVVLEANAWDAAPWPLLFGDRAAVNGTLPAPPEMQVARKNVHWDPEYCGQFARQVVRSVSPSIKNLRTPAHQAARNDSVAALRHTSFKIGFAGRFAVREKAHGACKPKPGAFHRPGRGIFDLAPRPRYSSMRDAKPDRESSGWRAGTADSSRQCRRKHRTCERSNDVRSSRICAGCDEIE